MNSTSVNFGSPSLLEPVNEEQLEKWRRIQVEISAEFRCDNSIDFESIFHSIAEKSNSSTAATDSIDDSSPLIGGLDISFHPTIPDLCCIYFVICEFANPQRIVYSNHSIQRMTIPYTSQFLSFRELPLYMNLIEELYKSNIELFRRLKVLLLDGCGILHERKCGLATHIGVEVNRKYKSKLSNSIATIGISKTLLLVDGMNFAQIKAECKEKLKSKGDFLELKGQSTFVFGAALLSADNCTNPVYVSCGNCIDLPTAIRIVTHCSIHRIAEPIRIADIQSKLHWKEVKLESISQSKEAPT